MATTTEGSAAPGAKPDRPALNGKMLFSLLIFAVGLWFVLANTESARIRIFLVTLSSPMWLVLAVSIGGGWIGGMLYAGRRQVKKQQRP